MKFKLTILLSSTMLIISQLVTAQVAMGGWRTHFSYNFVTEITQSKNKIFALSQGALFSIDKRDQGVELYSKVSGLNDTGIATMGYDKKNKILLVTYQNGNIDFMHSDGVKNLPDFLNKFMNVDKTIRHIMFDGNKAYLSCSFGIMALNMDKMEIQDTYFIGPNAQYVSVENTTLLNRTLYAATPNEVFFADVDNPQIISYENWNSMANLPGSGTITKIDSFGEKLILLRGGKLYRYENETWRSIDTQTNYTNIKSYPTQLLAFTGTKVYLFDSTFTKQTIDDMEEHTISSGIVDNKDDKMWFIDKERGIISYEKVTGNSSTINYYKPNGPALNTPYRMRFGGDRLFVVPGGRWEAQYNNPGKILIFEDNKWTYIDNKDIKLKTKKQANDFLGIAIDPNDNQHFFISSYGNGVFEFKNDTLKTAYTFDNSSLVTAVEKNFNYIRVDGAEYDKQGNIWFSNNTGAIIYQVLKKDNTWTKITKETGGFPQPSPLLISKKNNLKWNLSFRATPGIAVLDDNGTIDEQSDDKFRFFESFVDQIKGNILQPSAYYCITEDLQGAIWVGTDKGPIVLHNTENIFNKELTFSQIVIPRNDGTNVGDILLENKVITAIEVDGANRKWIGTGGAGVYLLSENGKETIKHFTTRNSPLPSDDILSLAINPTSGEIFFGTDKGLVSYQSDAAIGENTFDNAYIYPNPVRENYTGLITITGLIEGSTVKITDVAGNLISDSKSNGSIATWDGKNKLGEKVSSGVYLFNCVSPDNSKSISKKLLIIN